MVKRSTVKKCPSFVNSDDCGKNEMCSWNSNTNKCRKTRVSTKLKCPSLKTSDACGKNEICSWNAKTGKCRKTRVSRKYPITFLFIIIGGKKDDDDHWEVFPANKLSKEAKETFKLGVINQLEYYSGINTDTLSYSYKKEGLVVKTTVGFNVRLNSEESDEVRDYIDAVNEKSIWQTYFKKGELEVVESSNGECYKFSEVSVH